MTTEEPALGRGDGGSQESVTTNNKNDRNMIEVTRDKFYSIIGPLDVVLSVSGDCKTTEFKLRYGDVVGEVIDLSHYTGDDDSVKYFLTEKLIDKTK